MAASRKGNGLSKPVATPGKTGRSAATAGARARQPRDSDGALAPTTVSDYVTNRIRDAILEGTFALGSRLDQQQIAEEMGVSTIPIREALRRLEANGLVHIHPRRGAFVAEFSQKELIDIKRIREMLEELATRLAAPRLDADQLDRLTALNTRMAKLTAGAKAATWSELNREWHFMLYSASDSPILIEMIKTLWDRSSLYRHVYGGSSGHRQHSVAEHAEAIAQIRAGKSAAAARTIRNHIFGASARSFILGDEEPSAAR